MWNPVSAFVLNRALTNTSMKVVAGKAGILYVQDSFCARVS